MRAFADDDTRIVVALTIRASARVRYFSRNIWVPLANPCCWPWMFLSLVPCAALHLGIQHRDLGRKTWLELRERSILYHCPKTPLSTQFSLTNGCATVCNTTLCRTSTVPLTLVVPLDTPNLELKVFPRTDSCCASLDAA